MMRIYLMIGLVIAAMIGPAHAFEARELTTPKGFTFWHVEDHTVPTVAVEFAFHGGSHADADNVAGITKLGAALMKEGTQGRSSSELEIALDDIGASVSFDDSRNHIYGSFTSLAAFADEGFALLREVLMQPAFSGDAIDRAKTRQQAALAQSFKNPNSYLFKRLMGLAYPDQILARDTFGSAETIDAITKQDLQHWHRDRFAKQRLAIVVVGAIDAERAATLVDAAFGDLPDGGKFKATPAKFSDDGLEVRVIPFADMPQTIIVYAKPALLRSDPDFIPAYVMNHILGGGGFTSRLTQTIREEHGLAYSAGSGLYAFDEAGMWVAQAATRSDAANQTISLMMGELEKLNQQGVTANELADAKSYLTGSYALRFDGNSAIANQLLGVQLDGLGLDYIQTRNQQINDVTLDDINRVIDRIMEPLPGIILMLN